MTQVVLVKHAGVACVLSANQVLESRTTEADLIELFGSTERDVARALLVDTAVGRRRIDCAEARFGSLLEGQLRPLPEFLRQMMKSPHIVGIADVADGLRWLIDLSRWSRA